MISTVSWVPKGIADPKPKRFEISPAERQMLQEFREQQEAPGRQQEHDLLVDTKDVIKKSTKKTVLGELRMDEYSSSDEDEAAVGKLLVPVEDEVSTDQEQHNMEGEESNSDDDNDDDLLDVPDTREYMPIDIEGLQSMSLANVDYHNTMMMLDEDVEDEEDSDVGDTDLQPDDALVLVSKTEEDSSSLEVYVYEQKTGNLFIHHDISLPSPPLCLAHGDIDTEGKAGNYCAVGMFTTGIEVWNLDVLDALEPICVLGGEDYSRNSNFKKKKKLYEQPRLVEGSHIDAVMSLSWNACHRNVIASGSADKTVKLWNITDPFRPVATLTHHTDKVQSVLWHPSDGTLLATGSYDKTVALVDARSSSSSINNGNGNCKKVKIKADCESMAWDPFRPENLTVAIEDGTVLCWDVRKFSDKAGPLWSFVAHEYGGVSDVCYNSLVPGFMATCAVDKTVALWDAHCIESESNNPKACGVKDMAVGKLYSVSFYPSAPWLLGCGGSSGDLALWDMSQEMAIQSTFGDRLVQGGDETNIESKDKEITVDFSSALDDPLYIEKDEKAEKVRKKMEEKQKKSMKSKKKKVHRR